MSSFDKKFSKPYLSLMETACSKGVPFNGVDIERMVSKIVKRPYLFEKEELESLVSRLSVMQDKYNRQINELDPIYTVQLVNLQNCRTTLSIAVSAITDVIKYK